VTVTSKTVPGEVQYHEPHDDHTDGGEEELES